MKSLSNDADVQQSQEMIEGGNFDSQILKIKEDVPTAIYLLNKGAYVDGYVHWATVDGNRARIPCMGGDEGKGFAPRDCDLCQLALDYYQEAKNTNDPKEADRLKQLGNDIRAKYEAQFLAVKGEMAIDVANQKRVPFYGGNLGEVGILSLTKAQFEALMGCLDQQKYPFMKSKKDLVNRTLIFEKTKVDNNRYATTFIKPYETAHDVPQVEYNPEDFDFESAFKVDAKLTEQTIRALNGEQSDAPAGSAANAAQEITEDELGVNGDPTKTEEADEGESVAAETQPEATQETTTRRRVSTRK